MCGSRLKSERSVRPTQSVTWFRRSLPTGPRADCRSTRGAQRRRVRQGGGEMGNTGLYALPLWLLGVLLTGVSAGLAVAGVLIARAKGWILFVYPQLLSDLNALL